MELEQALQAIGLSAKESRVYLALLERGIGSAQAIARKAGLKRPTTYVILEELEKKGVIALIPGSTKKMYRPKQPEYLFEEARDRYRVAAEKLPELQARANRGSEKPHVTFHEGVDGIKEIENYKLEEMAGKEILAFYAIADEETQRKLGYFDWFHEKRLKLKISMRGVVPEHEAYLGKYRKTDEKYLRKMKVIPQSIYSSSIAIEIGETWVKTNDFENLQGLIIENAAFAKTMREIFEMVWSSQAKDIERKS